MHMCRSTFKSIKDGVKGKDEGRLDRDNFSDGHQHYKNASRRCIVDMDIEN